jgi:hypothetical protein
MADGSKALRQIARISGVPSAEIDVVISQTRASEALAAERTGRAVWRRTAESAASFATSSAH